VQSRAQNRLGGRRRRAKSKSRPSNTGPRLEKAGVNQASRAAPRFSESASRNPKRRAAFDQRVAPSDRRRHRFEQQASRKPKAEITTRSRFSCFDQALQHHGGVRKPLQHGGGRRPPLRSEEAFDCRLTKRAASRACRRFNLILMNNFERIGKTSACEARLCCARRPPTALNVSARKSVARAERLALTAARTRAGSKLAVVGEREGPAAD